MFNRTIRSLATIVLGVVWFVGMLYSGVIADWLDGTRHSAILLSLLLGLIYTGFYVSLILRLARIDRVRTRRAFSKGSRRARLAEVEFSESTSSNYDEWGNLKGVIEEYRKDYPDEENH